MRFALEQGNLVSRCMFKPALASICPVITAMSVIVGYLVVLDWAGAGHKSHSSACQNNHIKVL